jgi:cathepsin F
MRRVQLLALALLASCVIPAHAARFSIGNPLASLRSHHRVEADTKPKSNDDATAVQLEEHRPAFESFLDAFPDKREMYADAAKYAERLEIFARNMLLAAERQSQDRGSAVHGVTQFSDLTPEEFSATFLGSKVTNDDVASIREGMTTLPDYPTDDLPLTFDWREKGAVTKVKNQGACGSCWSFSTTGAVEGANFVKTGELVSLSEQQLVDCDHTCDPKHPRNCDYGCNGGLPLNAMRYVQKNGLDTETDYPYHAVDGKCASKKNGPPVASVSAFNLVSTDEAQIAAALVKHGPLSIGIDAAWMQTYVGGVACPWICNKQGLDHGVLIVGYGVNGTAPARPWHRTQDYWIVKNSWGTGWGVEGGYYHICKDRAACGLNTMVVAADA